MFSFKEAFSQAIAGTGYTLMFDTGVYIIGAPDQTTREASLLNFQFDKFGVKDKTMGGAGVMLAGYIATVAEGATGFGFDILSNNAEKTFSFDMKSATTREIADHIVSLGSKGVWVFYPLGAPGGRSELDTPVQVFSYSGDAPFIERIGCGNGPGVEK